MSRKNIFHKILLNRKKHYKKNHIFRTKIYSIILRVIFSCEIPKNADIDDTVFFSHHGFNIVINPKTKIGANTIIQHNVTIGEINSTDKVIIGKNVFIGAKSSILGNITIGDNVKIGAHSLVLNDIPSGCTVVGNPAKIIKFD